MPPYPVKEGFMIINHNMSALFANRMVKFNEVDLNKDIEKLSSGLRINRAGEMRPVWPYQRNFARKSVGSIRRKGISRMRFPLSRPPRAT